jgi:toxin ParE1/3/4
MARYQLTVRATTDLQDILDYIRRSSPTAARRVRSELRAAMRLIAEFPGMGHSRADVDDPSLRFWSVYSYVIAYRPGAKPLAIVRIVHGARDFGKLFGRG